VLQQAFRAIDTKGEGYLNPESLRKLLTLRGDKLSEEEVEEFMRYAVDSETGRIFYNEYAAAVGP